MDDDGFSVFDGKEQQIDSKRTLRVKVVRKHQLVAATPEAAKNFDRIFGERRVAGDLEPAKPEAVKAKRNYRDNHERIFGGDE